MKKRFNLKPKMLKVCLPRDIVKIQKFKGEK